MARTFNTKTIKSILLQLHLQGYWGKSGNLSKADRRAYIYHLIELNFIDKGCNLTRYGLEYLEL